MSYNVKEFRGEAHRPLRCTDGGQATLQYLAQTLPATYAEWYVPAKLRTGTAKSGGLFGSQVPMLVISHPNPPSHYFDIGIVINGQVISFPLLGYSTENTQANKKADAKGFKSLLTRSADEFALQEEGLWQTDVIDAILSLYHSNNRTIHFSLGGIIYVHSF